MDTIKILKENKVIGLFMLGMVSCGGMPSTTNPTDFVHVQINPSPVPSIQVPQQPSLEGFYTLPEGGYLDLVEDSQGMVTARSVRVTTPNPDGSTGTLPISSTSQLPRLWNKTYYISNLTFTAGYNVKSDAGTVLVGSFLVELIITKTDKDLKIQVIINNTSSKVLDRIITVAL